MKHYWSYCELCRRAMVVCGICGNNTCNGAEGKLKNGLSCHGCKQAYKKEKLEWKKEAHKFEQAPRIRSWRNF
jgi:hypothetical protein